MVNVQKAGGVQRKRQLWPAVETKQDDMHATSSVKLQIWLYIELGDTSYIQICKLIKIFF